MSADFSTWLDDVSDMTTDELLAEALRSSKFRLEEGTHCGGAVMAQIGGHRFYVGDTAREVLLQALPRMRIKWRACQCCSPHEGPYMGEHYDEDSGFDQLLPAECEVCEDGWVPKAAPDDRCKPRYKLVPA